MTKFITNECGHIVTKESFPVPLCRGRHMCGALFDPYGMSSDCMPAKHDIKICSKCLAEKKKMLKAEKETPAAIVKAVAKLLDCTPDRSSVLASIKKLKEK